MSSQNWTKNGRLSALTISILASLAPLSKSLDERTTSPAITENKTLCQYCARIDFHSISGLAQSFRWLRDAGRYLDISASSTQGHQLERCVLCNFFAGITTKGPFPSHLSLFLQFSALARIKDESYLQRWIDRHDLGLSPAFYLRLLADEDIQRYDSAYAIGLDAPLAYSKLSLALPSTTRLANEKTMEDLNRSVQIGRAHV